jgi:hypothetical protein
VLAVRVIALVELIEGPHGRIGRPNVAGVPRFVRRKRGTIRALNVLQAAWPCPSDWSSADKIKCAAVIACLK